MVAMWSFLIIFSVVIFAEGQETETYLHKCQRNVLAMAVSRTSLSGWDITQESLCAPLEHLAVCLLKWEPELFVSVEFLQEVSLTARKLNCDMNVQKLTGMVSFPDYYHEPPFGILKETTFDRVRSTKECRSILIALLPELTPRILTKELIELGLGSTQSGYLMSFWNKSVYNFNNYRLQILGWICNLLIEQLLRKDKEERLESFNVGDYLDEIQVKFEMDKSGFSIKEYLEKKDDSHKDDAVPESFNRNLEAFSGRKQENTVGTIPDLWSQYIRYDHIMKNYKEYLTERNKKPLVEEDISWGSGEDENDDEDSGKENGGFTSGEGQPSFDGSQDYDLDSHKNDDTQGISDYNETKNEATEEKQPPVDKTVEKEEIENVQVKPEYTPFRSWSLYGESPYMDITHNSQGLPARMSLNNRNERIFNQADEDIDNNVQKFAVHLKEQVQRQSDGDKTLTVESERRLADLQVEHPRYHTGYVVGWRSSLKSEEGNSCTVSRMRFQVVAALVLLSVLGV